MSDKNMHLEDAMDNTVAKVAVRIFVFLAPFAIAFGAFYISSQLGDIKKQQVDQTEKLQQVTGDVKVLNAKLDNGVIWRITELERWLNSVEQATKTP